MLEVAREYTCIAGSHFSIHGYPTNLVKILTVKLERAEFENKLC